MEEFTLLHRKIYKRTDTGAVQEWQQESEGDSWRTISGQVDGKKVTSGWHKCYETNPGKTNYRDPEAQCLFEVQANYTKKLETGYFESINDIDNEFYFEPMLADKWEARKGKIKYPLYTQPKLDGVRCIATRKGLFSRNGKPLTATPHIHAALVEQGFFNKFAIFDGELYNHDLHNNFNELISLIRKKDPNEEELKESAEKIQYHIYDALETKEDDTKFHKRCMNLLELEWKEPLVLVPTLLCKNEEDVDRNYTNFMENNYEGQMIRVDDVYENKRSKSLLKRKDFIDEEFEIVDILEGLGNRAGMAGNILIKLETGVVCSSGIKGTHEYCKQLLLNREQYIGGKATVRYFARTPDNIPRFPVCVAVYTGDRDV